MKQNKNRMRKIYTGIGSRETPAEILELMNLVGQRLAQFDWTLRSGGASGADSAFEQGSDQFNGLKEIYLPDSPNIPSKAFEIAQTIYPNWFAIKKHYVKRIMARNVLQVLGMDLNTPTRFVMCYTPDGCTSHLTRTKITGGTGQAIALSSIHNIPILNLRNADTLEDCQKWLLENRDLDLENDFRQPETSLF